MMRGFIKTLAVCGALIMGDMAVAVPALPPGGTIAPPAITTPAAGMFLVARRELPDPNFDHTVVLIVHHDDDGTLGLVVNRRSHARLADALPDFPGAARSPHRIFIGGPVATEQIVLLVRNEKAQEGLTTILDNVHFGADGDLLELLLRKHKPARDLRLYAGHAGWAPGQLHYEIARGDWHLLPADADSVFASDAEGLWERLIDRAAPIRIEVRRPVLRRAV